MEWDKASCGGRAEFDRWALAKPPRYVLAPIAVMMGIAGCGGGGSTSSAPATTTQTETAQSANTLPNLKTSDSDAFYFQASDRYLDTANLELDTGGPLYTGWNPSGPAKLASTGMKVVFFGNGKGCAADAKDGQVALLSSQDGANLMREIGLSATNATAWMPSGNQPSCNDQAKNSEGDSVIGLTDDGAGALAFRTTSAPDSFFGTFSSIGSNGSGANANIMSSFVNFRQPFPGDVQKRPWVSSGAVRLSSSQEVKSITLPTTSVGEPFAQTKQQLMATFVDSDCYAMVPKANFPCQVQFVFHTTIAQSNTTSFPSTARVWFDPAQGSMLIVSGLIPAAGVSVTETSTGQALYTSLNSATQNSPFALRTFDVSISFDQLKEAVRIGTAQRSGIAFDALSDDYIRSTWGPNWDNPASWTLIGVHAAQEIFNNTASDKAEIVGDYRSLYAGPL